MLAYKYINNTYIQAKQQQQISIILSNPNATRHHEITEPNQIILATKATLSFLCRHKHSHRFQIQTVSCTHTSTGTQKTHTDVQRIYFSPLYTPPTRTYHITIPSLLCILRAPISQQFVLHLFVRIFATFLQKRSREMFVYTHFLWHIEQLGTATCCVGKLHL